MCAARSVSSPVCKARRLSVSVRVTNASSSILPLPDRSMATQPASSWPTWQATEILDSLFSTFVSQKRVPSSHPNPDS